MQKYTDVLEKSPMFNLSLSSKELFHSNFLAWLCEIYPEEMGRIFFYIIPASKDVSNYALAY